MQKSCTESASKALKAPHALTIVLDDTKGTRTADSCLERKAEGQTLSVVLKVMLDRPMRVMRARTHALV